MSDSEDSDIDLPEDQDEEPLVVERPEKKVKKGVSDHFVGKSEKNCIS